MTTAPEPPPDAVAEWLAHLNRVGDGRYIVRYSPDAHDSDSESVTRVTSVRWHATLSAAYRFPRCEPTLYRATPYELRDALIAQEAKRPKRALL